MSEEFEEEIEALDLDAIGEKYEDKGYFKRLFSMFRGLGKPRGSAEYKLARIELQRQAAPLIAIVSVLLLVTVMIVLTSMSGFKEDALEVTIAEAQDEQDVQETPDEPEPPDDIEPPPLEDVEIMVDNPMPGPVETLAPVAPPTTQPATVKPATQDTVAFVDSPVKMKSMTGSRTPGSIGKMTSGGAGYGDPTTEATVMKVLWWLKATQKPDGSWGGGTPLANTALAMLTFLAHGEYPNSPSPFRKDFGPVVQKGIEYLTGSLIMPSSGGVPKMRGADGNEYAFLIATYALCEAYGMTKNPDCKDVAMITLKRIIDGQSPTGGWDYKMDPRSTRDDLSFAGWALQALKAGKMAGLHPEGLDTCIKKAVKCLQTRSFYKDHFTYCANARYHPGLTATGCLAMQLLGYGSQKEVRSALDYMKEWHPSFLQNTAAADGGVGDNIVKDCASPQYYCYYATQCKYQAGMKQGATKSDETIWQNWNAEMKKRYPSAIKDLPQKVKDYTGKEHRQGYYANQDAFSSRPVMDSCLVALQLMVYYRYLPTSQTAAGEDKHSDESASDQAVDKSDVSVSVNI